VASAAATNDPASGFTNLFENHPAPAAPPETSPGAITQTPYASVANAIRASEPALPAAPPLAASSVPQIAMRIDRPDSPSIDVRVVERAGQVHVDVRTSDTALQSTLRQDLGSLSNSLERAGYHTETITPVSAAARAAASSQMNHEDGQRNGQPDTSGRGGGEGSGGRRQQRQRDQSSAAWIEELEKQA
jgi:hypothetical protein